MNITSRTFSWKARHAGRPYSRGHGADGWLLLLLDIPDRDNKLLFFVLSTARDSGVPWCRRSTAHPNATSWRWRGDFCKLEGKQRVNGQLAAEGTVMCKMIDRDARARPKNPEMTMREFIRRRWWRQMQSLGKA